MGRRQQLPARFEADFAVRTARLYGLSRGRLRGSDLEAPFHGVRVYPRPAPGPDIADPYERQRHARVARAQSYAPILHTGHFFSHETAVSIWGGPLPLAFDDHGGIATEDDLALHVSASGGIPFPRARGVTGHRTLSSLTSIRYRDGLRVSSPAATWVSLGTLPLVDLVALGDYFCRRWRPGVGRPDVTRQPWATIDELREMLAAGRRRGAARLREAVELVREDSWSPRESRLRCVLVAAGIPEPQLNVDVFDDRGRFLACVDMVWEAERVAAEYHGMVHGAQWARDVERVAALRAAGWTVIEVTAPLLHRPEELIRRMASALGR